MQPIYAAILSLPLLLPHFVDALKTDAAQDDTRVWRLCEGSPSETATTDQADAGQEAANRVKCTKDMSFTELCCFNFAAYQTQLTNDAVIGLDILQQVDVPLELLQDDVASNKSAHALFVCTSNVPALTGQTNAVLVHVKCFTHDLTPESIMGTVGSSEDGNPVLNARTEFLLQQGVSQASIPTCGQVVPPVNTGVCSTGKPVAHSAYRYWKWGWKSSSTGLVQSASSSRRSLRQGQAAQWAWWKSYYHYYSGWQIFLTFWRQR